MRFIAQLVLASVLMYASPIFVWASGDRTLLDFDLQTDEAALQRGAEVFTNLCMMCHSLKYVKYNNLTQVGFTKDEIGRLQRDRQLLDPLGSMMTAEAMQTVFGMHPPDLSMAAYAYEGGAQYIYSLLLSYEKKADGTIENRLFSGIRMPDPFAYSVQASEQQKAHLRAKAADVVSFLQWTADPHAQERYTTGFYVILYLILLTVLLYFVKRRVWARLDAK